MALKAGRVGVAPDQVDEFGNIRSEATSGYTKQEADAKFETQTHAASTYETKSDAAELQPITLEVPIEMLVGTKLTVESALQGLNEEVTDLFTVDEGVCTDIVEGASVLTNKVYKNGDVKCLYIVMEGVSASPQGVLAKLPAGFRPRDTVRTLLYNAGTNSIADSKMVSINTNGDIKTFSTLTSVNIIISHTFI